MIFFRDGDVRVRLRAADDAEDEDLGDKVAHVLRDAEEESRFVTSVLDKLLKYEPPVEKKQSVLHRHVPEPFWVPARAILNKQETALIEAVATRSDSIETSFSDDGLILRMARHPRAADDLEHLDRCVERLSTETGIDEEEARQRLNDDDKFMQFWGTLRIIEAGSAEEKAVARSLEARGRMMADAHILSSRIESKPSWDDVKKALETAKWYRQLMGNWLDNPGDEETAKLEECLDLIADAWPDVKSVAGPQVKKTNLQGKPAGKGDGKQKGAEKGKSKGKGKDKGKSKGKK